MQSDGFMMMFDVSVPWPRSVDTLRQWPAAASTAFSKVDLPQHAGPSSTVA